LSNSPSEGIVPTKYPVPSVPHMFIPGVVKGNCVPPVPENRIHIAVVRFINGVVSSQPNA